MVTKRFNLLYERSLSKVSGLLVLVQRAIDLYMGLGRGKLRARERNLCLEHLKREWKLVPGNEWDLEKEGRRFLPGLAPLSLSYFVRVSSLQPVGMLSKSCYKANK